MLIDQSRIDISSENGVGHAPKCAQLGAWGAGPAAIDKPARKSLSIS
jgi:hypothetical protein